MSLYGAQGEACHLTVSAPSAAAVGSGAYTVAALYMPNIFGGANMLWHGYQSNDFSHTGLYVDGDMWCPNEQADTNIPSFGNPQQWYWFVVSKAAVTEAPRAHWAVYTSSGSISWTHLDAGTAQGVFSNINRFCLGDEFGVQFRGNIACFSAFTSELTDSQIESLFVRSSSDIMAAAPQFFMHWPQADGLGSPFQDIAGGGVETIRTGNWDVSTDPPGYNFTLGRSGKPKVWNGSSWVQHQAKSYDGSSWPACKLAGATVGGWVRSQ
jgi:hypothetical protein